MRKLDHLQAYRNPLLESLAESDGFTGGVFEIPSPDDGKLMQVTFMRQHGWDKVWVGREDRYPSWFELGAIRDQFFSDNETIVCFPPPPIPRKGDALGISMWAGTNMGFFAPPESMGS